MAAKEKEPPKHIQDFYKKEKELNVLRARTLRAWEDSHLDAQEKILKDDYSLLKKKEHRKKYAEHIADRIIEDAKKHFNLKDDLDQYQEARIMDAYIGITREQIRHVVEEHRENYEDVHQQMGQQTVDSIDSQLRPIAYEHLDAKEHLNEVIQHTGLDEEDLPELIHKSGLGKVLKDFDKHGHVRRDTLDRLQENPRRYEQNIRAYMRE